MSDTYDWQVPGGDVDITVLIPVYNGEDYLGQAIASVINQSGPVLEVVVIDDGSANDAAIRAVVDGFHDSRIRLLRKENGGVSTALNAGLEAARGRAIVWLSHDDLMAEDRLARQWSEFLQQPSGTILFGDYGVFEGVTLIGVVDARPIRTDHNGLAALARGQVNGCTVMAETAVLRSLSGFDEELRCTQDYDMWLRALDQGCRFRHVRGIHVFTRVHAAQTSRVSDRFISENHALWVDILGRTASRLGSHRGLRETAAAQNALSMVATSQYLSDIDFTHDVPALQAMSEQSGTLALLARYWNASHLLVSRLRRIRLTLDARREFARTMHVVANRNA